jgi:hypothetical protein
MRVNISVYICQRGKRSEEIKKIWKPKGKRGSEE